MSLAWDIFKGIVIVGGFGIFILAYFILPTSEFLQSLIERVREGGGHTYIDQREQHVHFGGLPGSPVKPSDDWQGYAATEATKQLRNAAERRRKA